MSLSQRIVRLLKGTGATYSAVANGAGCSPALIGHLASGERKNPSGALFVALATLFDVDLVWLSTGKGKAPTAEHLRGVARKRGFTRRGRATTEPSP